jgi:hypothetical protein
VAGGNLITKVLKLLGILIWKAGMPKNKINETRWKKMRDMHNFRTAVYPMGLIISLQVFTVI